jgi:hypothetical protein
LRPSRESRASSRGRPGLLRPAPTLPAGPRGCVRPPPAPAGAISASVRGPIPSPGCPGTPGPDRTERNRIGPTAHRPEPRMVRDASPRSAKAPHPLSTSQASLGHHQGLTGAGISVGEPVLFVVTSSWRPRPAGLSTTQQGDERFRQRWLLQEKRAEGGGRNLVKMRPQNTSANSNSTVAAPKAAFALAA